MSDSGLNLINQGETRMDLCPLEQMAERLGLPAEWLKNRADERKIPCLKVADHYLFNPSAVQEALAVEAAKSWVPRCDGEGCSR